VNEVTMITAVANALTVIGSLLSMVFIYQLWSAYRSNPKVAMAAIFNQGRGAFMLIGASLLIFALVHLAGIIVFSFYATDDSGWVFQTTDMFHSVAANFIWGIAIAIRKFGTAVKSTAPRLTDAKGPVKPGKSQAGKQQAKSWKAPIKKKEAVKPKKAKKKKPARK
jgi:hypothetical protein